MGCHRDQRCLRRALHPGALPDASARNIFAFPRGSAGKLLIPKGLFKKFRRAGKPPRGSGHALQWKQYHDRPPHHEDLACRYPLEPTACRRH
ncbi:hypothetical protein CNECB9_80011 [Cupriavidus necator]|uniref:Uncharacterized protein n=1 Tax=Cupriavidus necator TaxID=106590 RepID=A0A1K0ISJ0_CUPNE|nr:hypothetical protein CNECB9_80011 [Cupriavidus necator]